MLKWSGALPWQPSPKAKDWMPPTTNGRNMAVGKLALAVTEETSHVGPSELPLGTLPPTHPSKAPGAQGMAVRVIPPLDAGTGTGPGPLHAAAGPNSNAVVAVTPAVTAPAGSAQGLACVPPAQARPPDSVQPVRA